MYTRPHRNTYAVYSSYSREINPKWTAILGLRYTAISDPIKDQHVLTPQFQLLHTINKDSSMYLNVGKAYTMPSLSDTFRSVNRPVSYTHLDVYKRQAAEGESPVIETLHTRDCIQSTTRHVKPCGKQGGPPSKPKY